MLYKSPQSFQSKAANHRAPSKHGERHGSKKKQAMVPVLSWKFDVVFRFLKLQRSLERVGYIAQASPRRGDAISHAALLLLVSSRSFEATLEAAVTAASSVHPSQA